MEQLKNANWPLIVFLMLGVASIANASLSLAASTLVFGAYLGFNKYIETVKNLTALDEKHAQLGERLEEIDRKVMDVNSYVAGVSLKQATGAEKRRFF